MNCKIITLLLVMYSLLFSETLLPRWGMGVDLQSGYGLVGLSLRGSTSSNVCGIFRLGISPSLYIRHSVNHHDTLFSNAIEWMHNVTHKTPPTRFSVEAAIGYQFERKRLVHKPLLGICWFQTFTAISNSGASDYFLEDDISSFYMGYDVGYNFSEKLCGFVCVKVLYIDGTMHTPYDFANNKRNNFALLPTISAGITFY